MIVTHHPIVFSGLKSIVGKNYVEQTIIKAIKNDIAIYAIHTNLDNIKDGVNAVIAKKIGLENTKILRPKKDFIKKLSFYCPVSEANRIKIYSGRLVQEILKLSHCSFSTIGQGTFLGNDFVNLLWVEKRPTH